MGHNIAKAAFTIVAAGTAAVVSFEVYEASEHFDNGRDANACAQALGHGEATDLYFDSNPTCASLVIELANRNPVNEDTVTLDPSTDEVIVLDGQQAATGMKVEELQAKGRDARDAVRDNRWKLALAGGAVAATLTGIVSYGFGGLRRRLRSGLDLESASATEEPAVETSNREPITV